MMIVVWGELTCYETRLSGFLNEANSAEYVKTVFPNPNLCDTLIRNLRHPVAKL